MVIEEINLSSLSVLLGVRLLCRRFWSSCGDIPNQINSSSLKQCDRCQLEYHLKQRSLKIFARKVLKTKLCSAHSIPFRSISCPLLAIHRSCFETTPISQFEYNKIVAFEQKSLYASARMLECGVNRLYSKLTSILIALKRHHRYDNDFGVQPLDSPKLESAEVTSPEELRFCSSEVVKDERDYYPPNFYYTLSTNITKLNSEQLNFDQNKLAKFNYEIISNDQMEETTSSVQPGTNELNRLILAPIKAIKFRTYKRTVPPFWNRLSINKDWRPYPMTTSVEQIEQQVTATREAEEWEDRCVECNQLVAPVASRILTQVKRIPGRTRSMESLSKSDEQRLVGHFEVVGEEAIIGQFSKSRSIKRRKIPIEIEERFYQNYFETAKSESKSTYDSLPTIAARSESEQMLANCLH